MSNYNITIPLTKLEDKNGKPYFIAKIKAPCTIDCTNGVTFFFFASESGVEEMQIAPLQETNKDKSVKKEVEVYQKK